MKHVFYKCILKNSSMYEEGYDVLSGSRATGDGYYESSIVGIILILRLFNALCTKLFYGRVFRSQSAATRSATHLQRIYWNPVTISAPSKNFSVTAMFQPLWFTPTSSTAAVSAFKVLSTECDSSLYHLVKIGLICPLVMCSGVYYGRKMKLLGEVPV